MVVQAAALVATSRMTGDAMNVLSNLRAVAEVSWHLGCRAGVSDGYNYGI